MKKKLFALLTLFLFYSFTYAQESKVMTLDECLKVGLENSKNLSISKSKIEAADAKQKESYSAQLPSLKLSGGYTRLSDVEHFSTGTSSDTSAIAKALSSTLTSMFSKMFNPVVNNYAMKLSLNQPLFVGNKLSSATEIAELSYQASQLDFEKDKSQLIVDIKSAFWTLYKANEYKKTIDENIAQVKAHLADIESFQKIGMATENDVLKVKVQLNSVELSKIDAENNVELAKLALNNTLGIPLYSNTDIKAEAKYNEYTSPELSQLLNQSTKSRPEIKAQEIRVKSSETAITLAKGGWYPQINLNANYNYNRPNSRLQPTQDKFYGTWDVNLTFSFDLWNWQITSHQTQQAEATTRQANLGLEQIKDAITLDVAQSYLNVKKSKEKITVSEYSVKQAEENWRVTEQKFKKGVAINSDLIDAEVALMLAKINLTTSIADFEISLAKLEKAIGK